VQGVIGDEGHGDHAADGHHHAHRHEEKRAAEISVGGSHLVAINSVAFRQNCHAELCRVIGEACPARMQIFPCPGWPAIPLSGDGTLDWLTTQTFRSRLRYPSR
jgi:hypothetical protein